MAYYADLLRGSGRQSAATDLTDLDDFELELLHAWLRQLDMPDSVAAGWGTWAPRQAVAWLARTRFPGKTATEWFLATFFREVATYLRYENHRYRTLVRNRVAEVIAAHQADTVVAHSLGSVVAYETLWAYPELKVRTLITLGSPLALPHAVFPRLDPAPRNERGRRPPSVQRWINLADPGDLVAIPAYGVSRKFAGVDLDEHTVISAFDFHLAKNYLASTSLGRVLQHC
ncbi:serine peptidase [Streptomyces sp. NPDC002838]|uniref:serine peptidase n=1 Tax=Streptomyces sp. NPDC002838 TaxID=3154436 RepID=UPI0033206030